MSEENAIGSALPIALASTGVLSTAALQPGALVLDGRFRVLELLGSGGMGQVFVAEQVSLGRKVALKVLRRDMSLVAGMHERFRREALLLSSVDHPAVVRVIDFGYSNDNACLVMELVEGETLETALRQGPMAPARAAALLVQLAEGLAAIHERGIVHRDLKPENIFVTRTAKGEQARLLDFGIARLAQPTPEATTTQVGLVLGTPEFMAPEQVAGGALEARSDLYSLGVVAFRMLSGVLPFPGPGARDFLLQHLSAVPASLLTAAPQLAAVPQLVRVVQSCLEKDPSRRPASASALAASLSAGGDAAPAPLPLTAVVPRPSAPRPLPRATGPFSAQGQPQNLALMLTDIKGFTDKTSRQTHAQNAQMLEEHDGLLLPVVRAFAGTLVQKRGDALLVTFLTPTAAVHCGMAIQDRLWRHNAALPADAQLLVRVAIHSGEVLVRKEGLVGEPAQVVAAVEGVANAGEVVFTSAVRLAVNRAEVLSEERGELELPGGAERVGLHRCTPAASGAPFGGMDLQLPATSVPDRARELWRVAQPRVQGALAAVPFGNRTFQIAAAVVLAILLSATLIIRSVLNSPERRAEKLLEQGDWSGVLLTIQAARAGGSTGAEVVNAEALALHRLKRHSEECRALALVPTVDLALLSDDVVTALLEDFGKSEREPALREQLDRVGVRAAKHIGRLAGDSSSPGQWGALRYLDHSRVADVDLVTGYLTALESPDCQRRAVAALRLGDFVDPRVLEPLERLKATPKQARLFYEENCGQNEAAVALRKLTKKER